MQSAGKQLFSTFPTDGEQAVVRPEAPSGAIDVGIERDLHAELSLLNEIVRLLPAGVTVQDEHGRFLLVNDAAAARLKVSPEDLRAAPLATPELTRRRETCIELLRADRVAVTEVCVTDGHVRRTFLDAHRPVRIAHAKKRLTSTNALKEPTGAPPRRVR